METLVDPDVAENFASGAPQRFMTCLLFMPRVIFQPSKSAVDTR